MASGFHGPETQYMTPQERIAQLRNAHYNTSLYIQRARDFLQRPAHSPRMDLTTVTLANAIIFVRALDAHWPQSQTQADIPDLERAANFQQNTINLLRSLDFSYFVRMKGELYSLSDTELEVLRLFYVLVGELEVSVGVPGRHPMHVLSMYFHMAFDRAEDASEAVVRLHMEMAACFLVEWDKADAMRALGSTDSGGDAVSRGPVCWA